MAPYPLDDFSRAAGAAELVDDAVVFESDDGRDRADAEAGSQMLLLFGVDFDKLRFECEGTGRFFERGGHAPAGAAPRCPEIGDDEPFVIDEEPIEGCRIDAERFGVEQRRFAVPACGFRVTLFNGDRVDAPAMGANHIDLRHRDYSVSATSISRMEEV